MAGYIRQSVADILPGEDVRAEPLNAEFNRLLLAFSITGHVHDGTTSNGPKINLANSVFGVLAPEFGGAQNKNNTEATTNPTVNDDANGGYNPGSLWVNTVSDTPFIMVNNQVGAAIWRLIQSPTGTFLTPGNNLSDLTNSTAARVNLGLIIGTNVMPYSPRLAALTTGSTGNLIPYYDGTTYQFFTTTSYSRGLLANAAASNWRTSFAIENVDNTSDANKPVSTATQTALNLKANSSDVTTSLALKANLASPALTGTPTAPTASAGTNTTQLATTAFVTTAVSATPVPVKVSGTELRALTDDAKFVTAKAHADAMGFNSLGVSTSPYVINLANGFNNYLALSANITFNAPTNPKAGLSGVLQLVQDATGGRTATWATFWNFGADGPPTLSTAPNAVDYVFYTILSGATSAICSFKTGQ